MSTLPKTPAEYRKNLNELREKIKNDLNACLLRRDSDVAVEYDYLQARMRKIDSQLASLIEEVA